ncbi:MAG: hypothetical protein AAGK17_12225 [Pseudomonadota bacterium]
MKKTICGVAVAALISSPVLAQSQAAEETAADAVAAALDAGDDMVEEAAGDAVEVPPPPPIQIAPALPPAPPEPLMLSSGVPIKLVVTDEVNSSTHEAGDIFDLTVLEDVTVNNTVVIPRGTPAKAEITWRTGKGAFGKSGKLEFALRSIDLKQGSIPVSGEFRQEGEGNTVATGVGVLAVGVFAGFITGKRARLPQGRELLSQTVGDVMFTPAGSLDPSYDSEKAMYEATANEPLTLCKAEAGQIEKEKKRAKAIKKCYVKRLE